MGWTMKREARHALIEAHQRNLDRYCRLRATQLTDLERQYIHRRIVKERTALEKLSRPPDPNRGAQKLAGIARPSAGTKRY
jgi:hypothetical protein